MMKTMLAGRFLAVTMLAGLLMACFAFAQKEDQAEVLMQAAHQKQLVEGRLEEAIQLYKRIVQDHPGNRVVAAQALLEMGQCYEKLGNAEARKAYERVLRDYGDQSEVAAAARKRLATLAGTIASSSSGMMTRRVWAGPDVHVMGSLSPDGRYLSCVDATTGDLALRDLTTGKMRRLTNEGSRPEVKASAISRDGKEVAYNWPNKVGWYPDLRVMRVDGSAPRVLYNVKGAFAWPHDWSPDGKYILSLLYVDPMIFQIAVISKEGGSARVLKTLDWFPTKLKFSPDGRYIAYDLQQQDSGNRDIFLLAADGSREIRLIEHPADDQLLGWTPDGNHILFASDRSGTMSAWLLRVVDGKPQGSPDLVKPDIGQIIPIGFTPAGSFYYGLAIGTGDVYTAEFDPATGRVLTEPQIATQRYIGWNASPAWSPDGQYLAYISRNLHWLASQRPAIITIRSLKTGEERDLSPNLPFMWGPIRWSPDGRSILVSGKDSKAQHGLYLIDAQTAKATPIEMWQGEIDMPAWFPDGKRLLYRSWQLEAGTITQTILVRDLETGRETEFFRPTPGLTIDNIALSPDGREMALTLLEKETRSSVLKALPTAGGDGRELIRAKEPETIFGDSLSWSSDSRYIVFAKGRAIGQERKTQLLAISSRGGEPHALGLAMDSVHDVSFHPNGHHLAFTTSAGEDAGEDKIEVWVMENFLPTLKVAQRR
jgi:Tol biopolymer transport system component